MTMSASMNTKLQLLLFFVHAVTCAPKPIAMKQSSLPGVPRTDRATLILLRDAVASWYCAKNPERTREAPCILLGVINQWNEDTVPDVFLNDSPPKLERKTAKMQFQKMFTTYCLEATADAAHDEVCSNAILLDKYKISTS